MKKLLLLLCLMPILSISQTQIGNDIDGEAAGDKSAWSISLSADGTVVAIGAPLNDGNGTSAGHVRVYENIAGTWTQVGADIEGEAAGVASGYSVSLSADGSVVAIGAILNDGNGTDSGHVRVYQNNSGTWIQVGADIDGEAAGDESGNSVSLSADGTVVAIGARSNDGNGTNAGHVRVYQNNAGTWTQVGADIDGESSFDESGESVSLSADATRVAIGSIFNTGNGFNAGHVRVYENIAGTWTQVGADIDGETEDDLSGESVSLSSDGTEVAIGAIFNDGNGTEAGHVRVYENNAGTWTQVGADIDGEAAGDRSGTSVSLSADGTVVAIGAIANGGNGANAGHVRVYQNIGGTWTQAGSDIDGEAPEDRSGWSVSLSSDASGVAVGSIDNTGNGTNAGQVRVFDLSSVLSSDPFVQTHFSVYPNPAAGSVTVQLSDGLELKRVNVYSTLGQLIKCEYDAVISLNELAKGNYFLEVITEQGKATKTIVVK